MLQDLRYAIRSLRRAPGFASVVALTIAMGIGTATAMFSVLYGVLLRPLPYPNGDRLVRVWEENPGASSGTGAMTGNRWLSNRTYHAWLEHARTIDTLGGYSSYEYPIELRGQRLAARVSPISPSLLEALGASPTTGRLFADADADRHAEPVALLSEPLWRDATGGDESVIGQQMSIDGEAHRVVGVLPASFQFPDRAVRVWVPLAIPRISTDPAQSGATMAFTAVGRLRAAVTREQAATEGTPAARSVPRPGSAAFFFGSGGGPVVVHVRPLADDMSSEVRPAILVLAAAVGLLLIAACANVANLLLSRGVVRQREIAIHAALGASRARVARQLLTEHALLSALGGSLGVLFAWWLVRLMPRFAPPGFPRLDDISMDVRTLVFALCASVVTAVVAGLLPLIRGSREDVASAIRGGDRAGTSGFRDRSARWWRDTILIVETAMAAVLLVGMALLSRSFVRLTHVDAGYDADHVLAAHVQTARGATTEQTQHLVDSVLAAMRATPGVVAAGAGNMMPFVKMTAISGFSIPPFDGRGEPIVARSLTYTISPGYAEALRLRLKAGRFFNEHDRNSGVQPLLINEEFRAQYLGPGPGVGRRFTDAFGREGLSEVVGVVAGVLKDGNDKTARPEVYFVDASIRDMRPFINFVVRTSGDPARLAPALRETIRRIDASALVGRVEPLIVQRSASVSRPRFATIVMAALATAGAALAALGLFSVLSYAVSQRRREFGVRAALGADRRALITLVLRGGLALTLIGATIGVIAAALLSRFMRASLFGIAPLDPLSFAAAPAILLIVATAACLLPAIRAARTDPSTALRADA
jgi:putative ABC transport system permease protein